LEHLALDFVEECNDEDIGEMVEEFTPYANAMVQSHHLQTSSAVSSTMRTSLGFLFLINEKTPPNESRTLPLRHFYLILFCDPVS
jgi:hypothetical protein